MRYDVNARPSLAVQVLLGLQHVFAAFGGVIVVPIIVSNALNFDVATSTALISGSILAAGLATIVQSLGIGPVGARLPSLMGTDVTFSAPAIAVGQAYGMPGIIGAILAGGVIESVLSFFTKHIIRFFPKVVAGVVITLIGLTLLANSIDWLGGGANAADYGSMRNILVGLVVMAITLVLSYYGRGFFQTASILIGMVIGYLICIPLGMVNFSGIAAAPLFSLPNILANGVSFHLSAIIAFLPAFLVGVIGTVGRIKAIEGVAGIPESDQRVQRAILADGVTTVGAGLVGGLTNTTFAQNIGLLSITKVVSRYVTIMAGIILTILGLFPAFAAVIHAMPQPVLGGAGVIMFGMIAVAGINILREVEFDNRNMLIIAISLGFGLGVAFRPAILSQFPEQVRMIFSSGITTGTIVAILLNLILHAGRRNDALNLDAAGEYGELPVTMPPVPTPPATMPPKAGGAP